jgi:hypothetical protein
MQVEITIAEDTFTGEDRNSIHSKLSVTLAMERCKEAKKEPTFRCACGHPLVPFSYKSGYRFKRVSRLHVHNRDKCGFYRDDYPSKDRSPEMFRGLRHKKLHPRNRAQGLGVVIGEVPSLREMIDEFTEVLLRTSYRTAHLFAFKPNADGHRMPTEHDFVEGVLASIEELQFHGRSITSWMSSEQLWFEIAVGYLPAHALDCWDDTMPLFVTKIPLYRDRVVQNEIWMLPLPLLSRGIPERKLSSGSTARYHGAFFAIAARKANGEFTDFQITPAFHTNGVYGPIDSQAEAELAAHFASRNEAFFRVAHESDIECVGPLFGLPSDVAAKFRRKPDFLLAKKTLVRLVEATSFAHGPTANKHSLEVLERIEHYLYVALGYVEVELWQLGGPVPQQLGIIRTWDDLETIRGIISRNSQTGINI